jgi:hypothetical protein
MLSNPILQALVIAVVVYFVLDFMKPSVLYNSNGMLKNPMCSPMNMGLMLGSAWAAYQVMYLGVPVSTGTDSFFASSNTNTFIGNANLGSNISSTARAGVSVGDTFYE